MTSCEVKYGAKAVQTYERLSNVLDKVLNEVSSLHKHRLREINSSPEVDSQKGSVCWSKNEIA